MHHTVCVLSNEWMYRAIPHALMPTPKHTHIYITYMRHIPNEDLIEGESEERKERKNNTHIAIKCSTGPSFTSLLSSFVLPPFSFSCSLLLLPNSFHRIKGKQNASLTAEAQLLYIIHIRCHIFSLSSSASAFASFCLVDGQSTALLLLLLLLLLLFSSQHMHTSTIHTNTHTNTLDMKKNI